VHITTHMSTPQVRSFPRRGVIAVAVATFLTAASFGALAQNPRASEARVLVAFKPGAAAAVQSAIARSGGRVTVDLSEVRVLAVSLPRAAVAALARNPQVEYVEDDKPRRALALTAPSKAPYQPGQLVPYGIPMVQADLVSDAPTANIKVCIVDSGYETAHEDLAGNIATGQNYSRSGQWYTDENGHGTHVGGTVSAVNNANVGVVGVLPNRFVSLHIAKVFDASGSASNSTVDRAALDCVRAGAKIISMSLGGEDSSQTEARVFQRIADAGVLSIAAAGNDGNNLISYPGGYPTVMSVAAVDEKGAWATFSQFNATVEISGPGVGVYSTVPTGTGREPTLTIGRRSYASVPMEGTPAGTANAPLANFGQGTAVDAAMAGKVCLIQRGTVSFAEKVVNCQASGGVGAIVYNNVDGELNGTLGTTVTNIPSVGVTAADGADMLGQLGQTANLSIAATDYGYNNGTSMATPHVSAVAALAWSHHPQCTAQQIRATLTKSAKDLGAKGRDDKTGYGLVQAKAAIDRIASLGCGN
jgi:subtilisin family serine protease